MKKLFLSIATVVAVMSMTSCSGTKKAEDKGAELKSKIENCSDPDSLKIYVQEAQEYAYKLVEEGKNAEAEAYIKEVAPVVESKQASTAGFFSNLAAEADTVTNNVVDATKNAADSVGSKVSDKYNDVKDGVKDAASATADKTKEVAGKTKEVAGKAKDATVDAVKSGADKVKDAFGK